MLKAGKPKPILPHGAIDTHFHVFGPEHRYPYAPDRSYTPPDAAFETWHKAAQSEGISAGVLVQASVHGFDNSQIADMLRNPPIPLRGVAALAPETNEQDLADLDALGFRGARVNTVFSSGMKLAEAEKIAALLRGTGWHLEFLSDVSQIDGLRSMVERLDLPVVFAHFGHVQADRALATPGVKDLLGLVQDGLAWVKLSGPARITSHAVPPYDDIIPLVEAFCAANPDRLLWGSDWPHTALSRQTPTMKELVDMAVRWLPDPELASRVLVTNPRKLYGFSEKV